MPRYKITSDTDLDEYFGFGEPKKTTAERHFGEQNIPSLGPGTQSFHEARNLPFRLLWLSVDPWKGHYTVPKPRSEKDRARALEVNEDITRHVPLSDRFVLTLHFRTFSYIFRSGTFWIIRTFRSWYRSTIAAKDATMGDAALNADLPREPIVQRKSRVQKIFKNSDYTVPDYTPGSYSKSLYGYGKGSGKDIETSLAEVRAEKEAAKKGWFSRLPKVHRKLTEVSPPICSWFLLENWMKTKKAANDRLKKEWQVEPPKCLLSGMSGKDADMYSIGNSIIFFKLMYLYAFKPIILLYKKPKKLKLKLSSSKWGTVR